MSNPTKRRLPMVFRIAGAVLLVAAIASQVWQRRPVGNATRALLGAVVQPCPAAASHVARPTIANGARALDASAFRKVADVADPLPMRRCAVLLPKDGGKRETGRSFEDDEKSEEVWSRTAVLGKRPARSTPCPPPLQNNCPAHRLPKEQSAPSPSTKMTFPLIADSF